jgi:hypothetical protein
MATVCVRKNNFLTNNLEDEYGYEEISLAEHRLDPGHPAGRLRAEGCHSGCRGK